MKRLVVKSLVVLGVVFGLNACSKETPKCSDEDVQVLVSNLYADMLENSAQNILLSAFLVNAPKSLDRLESVRAVSYDKEVKLRECKAVAHFENGYTADIEYTVQLSETNHDEFYVELKGDFLQQLMMNSILSR